MTNGRTTGHSAAAAIQILVRLKKKKSTLSDQALEQVIQKAWGTQIHGDFQQVKVLRDLVYLQDWPYFDQDVGPDDPQRSHSITIILYLSSK